MTIHETNTPIISPERVLALTAPDGKFIIECFDLQTHTSRGYVKAFDPEFAEGRGGIDLTDDKHKALRWKDFLDACDAWKLQSRKRPLREDRKPNRPMTAFSIQIVQWEKAK